MERDFGLGLIGLIDPVTKEFNHTAVLHLRGGRHENEVIGNTKDLGLHKVMGTMHGLLVGAEKQELWMNVAGRDFDQYDFTSFFYGWIIALQEGFTGDSASNCFYAAFALIQQSDYLVQDFLNIFNTLNFYNLLVYTPTHIQGNFAASYE